MTENAIAKEIVDAAFRIHTTLGPGLLESVYDTVLAYELDRRGLRTVRQRPIPVVYESVRIDTGFRAERSKELLPVRYVHVVFTLPHELSWLALQNKKVVYDLLFRTSAATLLA